MWEFYNIDNKEKLSFIKDNIHNDQDIRLLKFCPVLHNNDVVLATWNSKLDEVYLE